MPESQLAAASCIPSRRPPPTDVWAVGWTGGDATTDGQQTLIEHWNGTAWTRVPSPNPADAGNFLHGVAATSPRRRVGCRPQANYTGHEDPLILHWNGTTWQQVPSNSQSADAELSSGSHHLRPRRLGRRHDQRKHIAALSAGP